MVRQVDNVLVKGKNRPVLVYEVLGDKDYQPTAAQQLFTEGFAAYHRRDFTAAHRLFQRGADEDKLCQTFATRCEHYQQEPPADDWDGVWQARQK